MQRGGCVYIMANRRNGTLYTGVTARLHERIYEHRECAYPSSFTSRYGCRMLVWYCGFGRIEDAISEEKRIKGGSRAAKLELIESMNPGWRDLWEDIEDWV